ncbi:hypothetical protein IE969_07355 [Klebsiella pneumoniae]|nr:hypothetical protein [Klebsiella pneumoniae]
MPAVRRGCLPFIVILFAGGAFAWRSSFCNRLLLFLSGFVIDYFSEGEQHGHNNRRSGKCPREPPFSGAAAVVNDVYAVFYLGQLVGDPGAGDDPL